VDIVVGIVLQKVRLLPMKRIFTSPGRGPVGFSSQPGIPPSDSDRSSDRIRRRGTERDGETTGRIGMVFTQGMRGIYTPGTVQTGPGCR
jgi:hypothetical protein